MQKIVFVGTIHLNWTPKGELEQVLQELSPDRIFVELCPEELEEPRENSIRDEMFVAYDWAHKHNVDCFIFDINEGSLKEGVTGKEPEFMEQELRGKDLLKNYSWKELNKVEPWQDPEVNALEKVIKDKYFDEKKMRDRENALVENIKKNLVDGTNVVITGAGHLTFFQKQFPNAELPFRY